MSQARSPVIALFLADLEIGGAERMFVRLARDFVGQGYRVQLLLSAKRGPLLSELDPGVEIVDLKVGWHAGPTWIFGLHSFLTLRRHLAADPPDVLLSTLTGANLVAILARRFSGRRFRLIIREAVTLDNLRSRLRRFAMRMLYPKADAVIALTATMKAQIVSHLKLPDDKVLVIGNAVDVQWVRNRAADPAESALSEMHKPYWLALGRLAPQKDFGTLIDAVAQTSEATCPRLVLLGDGPLRQQMERKVAYLGLEDRVVLEGMTPNPYPWLANAIGLVLSSRWEGYPNVLLEAMSLGLPIVTTFYDQSVTEIVRLGPDSVHRVVPVGDSSAMARAMEELGSRGERRLETPGPAEGNSSLPGAHTRDIANAYLAVLLPHEASKD